MVLLQGLTLGGVCARLKVRDTNVDQMSYDLPQPEASTPRTTGEVQVVKSFPPNIAQIRAAGLEPTNDTVFTYGRDIYNPKGTLTKASNPPLWAHELVHVKQQGNAVKHWWDRYLSDPTFRLWQEVAAYHKQFRVAKRGRHPKLVRAYLDEIANHLAGPLYGGLVSLEKARHLIQHGHV